MSVSDGITADDVRDYYGKTLQTSDDLQTSACIVAKSTVIPKHIKEALSFVHPEVASKFFGCGLIAPESLEGCRILDLGCGSGQDCFALAKLAGPQGHVTGIDMTDEQLEIANKYTDYHRKKFGFDKANTDFVKGFIEDLETPGLQENTFDIVVSNCVINLSLDKRSVFREAYRVLKVGGELYFSDMYVDRALPEHLRKNKVLWGEGLAGSLYWGTLFSLASEIGFTTPRLVKASEMTVTKPEIKALLGGARYVAATYRLFKVDNTCKKSKLVTYKGTLIHNEDCLDFDYFTKFKVNEAKPVTEELGSILSTSRFRKHFDLTDVDDTNVKINPFDVMIPSRGTICCVK